MLFASVFITSIEFFIQLMSKVTTFSIFIIYKKKFLNLTKVSFASKLKLSQSII